MMGTLPLVFFYLVIGLLPLIKLTLSQFPFSLNIPTATKCPTCKFNWPRSTHYGYSFNLYNSTVNLDTSQLVTFSAIAINYDSYDSTHPSCDATSGFLEQYYYQISIYYRQSVNVSWVQKEARNGEIDRDKSSGIDRIPLNPNPQTDPPIILTTGLWYIGLQLWWMVVSQRCDFIVDGWNISNINGPTYPIAYLIAPIPQTNHVMFFKDIICLQGDVAENNAHLLSAAILPHFDIEFEISTLSPTISPTDNPTTSTPTIKPTISPSNNPSITPTKSPSSQPTITPTNTPTISPSTQPSAQSIAPSLSPTHNPSIPPTSGTITPTNTPTISPTIQPSAQSISPSLSPTKNPAPSPTSNTSHPSSPPSITPSINPTINPTYSPSAAPTNAPTDNPTDSPSIEPTYYPSIMPTINPIISPTRPPTQMPTMQPTDLPTFLTYPPSPSPTAAPTTSPTDGPTEYPSFAPTDEPTFEPTAPSTHPTNLPTTVPTHYPSDIPTYSPSLSPSYPPTISPTNVPTYEPTSHPTTVPTYIPTIFPTVEPTNIPTHNPTNDPTLQPTNIPSHIPTIQPTFIPTTHPSIQPTNDPTHDPTHNPSLAPSSPPSVSPSQPPTLSPSTAPTTPPTMAPTPHCPALFVTVLDADNQFNADHFNGLYTFDHGHYIHGRPVWQVPQMATDKNIQYTGTHWTINGENSGILSHFSHSQYPPTDYDDSNAQWLHSTVSGVFHVQIKCVHTFAPIAAPTNSPSQPPTTSPTYSPSASPTYFPTTDPSTDPTSNPTVYPTQYPTFMPTYNPTAPPTYIPTVFPTTLPSVTPTYTPTVSPSLSPTDIPSNAPSSSPTVHPTDSPIISIPTNATYVKMVFMWNVSKSSIDYDAVKANKQDINGAIIEVAYKYYNVSLQVTNVYVYGEGSVPWLHLDVFTLCKYKYSTEAIDSCQTLQKDKATFKWLVFNELIKLNSNLANIDATLAIDRLPENSDVFTFYASAINIASGKLSEWGLTIKIDFEYLLLSIPYTHTPFECKDVFIDKTVTLFGRNHYCTWSTSTVLLVHLGFNHALNFEFQDQHILHYHAFVFIDVPPITIYTHLLPPEIIHAPNVIVSGSRHIGICDYLYLNVGSTHGNIGKSLYYKWSVYFETFKYREEGLDSQFMLTPAALQTFGVALLRIELYSANWLGGNNTNIVYVHYDNKRNIPSLEIPGNNIKYHSFLQSNIIITPNGKPFLCYPNTNYTDYVRYSWQQIYELPKELAQQILVPWPQQEYITKYQFDIDIHSKSLYMDIFDFYSSFNGNFSLLPSIYFKLTMSQFDVRDKFITSIHDYIAIQLVWDLPIAFAAHSIVHNADNIVVLSLSIYDFFQFSELLLFDAWIKNIYQFDWQCAVYDGELKTYSKQCSLSCRFDDDTDTTLIEKVFDYGCFAPTQDVIYQISLTVKLQDKYINTYYEANDTYISSIIYIHTTTNADIHHVSSWQNLPKVIPSSQRNILAVNFDQNEKIAHISWTCADKNVCPADTSLDSFWFFHSYNDYHSKTSQLIINPYRILDARNGATYDNYGCFKTADTVNAGAVYELQMIADHEYLIATVSVSLGLGIRGQECNLTATDQPLRPMSSVFTIKCGEFTTAAAPLMYNVLLVDNNIANGHGTWLNEEFLFSSFFQFILGAGNYSVRVIVRDANGDSNCVLIAQNVTIDIANNNAQYIRELYVYGNNVIKYAVLEKDYSSLIQNALALSNTFCCFKYDQLIRYDNSRRLLLKNEAYIEWNEMILNVLNVHINISQHVINMDDFDDFFRYKAIISVYRHLLNNLAVGIFDEIVRVLMDMSIGMILERNINIESMVIKLYKLMQTMPYKMAEAYFTKTNKWNLSEVMSYDLYYDLLTIINLMRQNKIDLSLLIKKVLNQQQNDNIIKLFNNLNITDHNNYIASINNLIKNVNLIFSNKFAVGEALSWHGKGAQVQVIRSETDSIDCGLTALHIPSSMNNYITAYQTDCIVLNYAVPQWISYENGSEPISTSIQIDLYSVNEDNKSQTHIDDLQFTDECEAIMFKLPIISNQEINDWDDILAINTTYRIPQCVYFEWETQTWSGDGCWIVNYTLDATVCACAHLNSFSLVSDDFTPNLSITTSIESGPFESEILLQDPVCWMFVVALILLLILSLLCVPTINSIPLIARSNVILRAERDEMLSSSWIGAVMLTIRRRDRKYFAKFCSLYGLNLRNQHSLLTICCGMEGMNITTTNLLLIFMSYIVTVMILAALYYSSKTSKSIDEISYSICISLISGIPLLLFRYFMKNSKPLASCSYYLTVNERNMDPDNTLNAAGCMSLLEEEHSVSYCSLTGAGYKSSSANINNQTDDDLIHDEYGMYEVRDLASNTKAIGLDTLSMIVPGAEWKCNRCNKFNDSDYQFCGYCSHKRLSIVEEATYEESDVCPLNSKSPQPGSALYGDSYKQQKSIIILEQWDEMSEEDAIEPVPSLNAPLPLPLPMPPPPAAKVKSKKNKKKKRHFYNRSDSSELGNKYLYLGVAKMNKHNPQQSSMLSSVFADDDDEDLESESITFSDDDDDGDGESESDSDSESNTATFNKYKSKNSNQKLHIDHSKKITDSAISPMKKPWSMSSTSPTLSAVSHTNIDDDLNTTIGTLSSGGFSMQLHHRANNIANIAQQHHKVASNLSDLSDQHSQIGDIPISPLKHNMAQYKQHYLKSSSLLQSSPQKFKHIRGMSSMSSIANYTENDSLFMLTDMETSVEIDNDMLALPTPYTSDVDHVASCDDNKDIALPALNEIKNSNGNGNGDRRTSISRRTFVNMAQKKLKEKFALPAKYDTNYDTQEKEQQEAEEISLQSIESDGGHMPDTAHVNTEKIKDEKPEITAGKSDSLSKILLKVKHINDVRQELIGKTYIFPHKCKDCMSILMWVYILFGFAIVIYMGTQFNTTYAKTAADDGELLLYDCNNTDTIPYEVKLNYKISQYYASNVSALSEYSPYSSFSDKDTLSNSTKWAMSVVLAILFYVLLILPVVLLVITFCMLYNTLRGRTFDVNCNNICYKLCFYDILCCYGNSIIFKKYKQNESNLVACKTKTKKHKHTSSANTNTKFHGIPQNNLELELEISDINKLSDDSKTRERLHSFSGHSFDSSDDGKHEINIYDVDEKQDGNVTEYRFDASSIPDSFTEYAFLCNDEIFVNPTKAEEQRLEFMSKQPLQLKPSSIQKKIALQNQVSPQKKRKRKSKKSAKKKRKRIK